MTTYDYRFGPEPVAIIGAMRAFGRRVLCRAILDRDYYKGELALVTYNAIDAVAFEIVSVGKGVAKACDDMGEDTPTPGQHCDVRSVAADRVHSKDPTGRFWLVDVADIAAVWDPVAGDAEGLDTACAAVIARSKGASATVSVTA